MGFKYLQKIPTPAEILQLMPMPERLKKVKAERDKDIINIIKGSVHHLAVVNERPVGIHLAPGRTSG
jgi:3-deoxy-D-arabino-heptulosonate 7-phosphate (DAHP) synthase